MSAAVTLSLTGPLADDVRAAAQARGLSPEEYVRLQLASDLLLADDAALLDADPDIEEDLAAVADYERDGVAIPGEDVLAWLRSIGTDNELPRPQPRKLK